MKLVALSVNRAWPKPSLEQFLANLAALRQERSELRILLALDDHLLLDVGLLREEVETAWGMLWTCRLAVWCGRAIPLESSLIRHLHRLAAERQARPPVPRPRFVRL
jgi:uncharacterized protein YjiS (DUF1127 family)